MSGGSRGTRLVHRDDSGEGRVRVLGRKPVVPLTIILVLSADTIIINVPLVFTVGVGDKGRHHLFHLKEIIVKSLILVQALSNMELRLTQIVGPILIPP